MAGRCSFRRRRAGSWPTTWKLTDLGEHRLKDLTAPQRLYQLGRDRFPPLRTLHRSTLPVQGGMSNVLGTFEEAEQLFLQILAAGRELALDAAVSACLASVD